MRRTALHLSDALYAVSRVVVLTLPMHVSDVEYYLHLASRVLAGDVPYTASFALEYPPLALVPLWLAGVLARAAGPLTLETFRPVLHLVLLAFDGWTYWLLRRRTEGRGLWAYPLATGLLGYLLLERLDVVLGWSLALAVTTARPSLSGAALAVGALVKFTPGAALPALALHGWRSPVRGGVAFLAVLLGGLVPALVLGGGRLPFLEYHQARGIQVESVWASVLYLPATGQLSVTNTYGGQHLAGPGVATVGTLSVVVLAAGLAAALLLTFRARHARRPALASLVVVLTFVMLNRVLSPQYWLFVAPLAVLAAAELEGRDGPVLLALLVTVCALTAVLFRFYWLIPVFTPWALTLLGIRNLAGLGLLAVAARGLASRGQYAPRSATPEYAVEPRSMTK